jgi:mRNA-degrading endonuclease RelE of RelBE toxin-antitoxin system
MAAHKWLLIVQPAAQQQFNGLARAQKRAVFRHLMELLKADDPFALPFVEMLKGKKFARVRKFRVGDYRVFLVVESGEVIHLKGAYKGRLYVLDIRDRKEAY